MSEIPENPYLLLTPGPLSTSRTVKEVMLRDYCTWDEDYNLGVVQVIRRKLVRLATRAADAETRYTSVLMQGSGTFSVESVVGSVLPPNNKLLVLSNGAYGQRLVKIARALKIPTVVHDNGEVNPPNLERLEAVLATDATITHVAVVHVETTTGMLNSIEAIGKIVKAQGRIFIVDAMSSFGGVPLDVDEIGIDFTVSSANKCIQGVPGFGFIVARRLALEQCRGYARSLSLDLYDQWATMEANQGKWRFTSPTHTVRAFAQALDELEAEGGVQRRHARYTENQQKLVSGMEALGFGCLLPRKLQSPIITAFHNPSDRAFVFKEFYDRLKARGFVIYPGKVTDVATFRIGTIGEVYPPHIEELLDAVKNSMYWRQAY